MLNEFQTDQVWKNMLAAETRSLYFADLAARYTRQKQWITGASFFLASGAAASLIGKLPTWVPLVASILAAMASAYSMAVGLDRRIGIMAKLHSDWGRIATDYQHLWNHTFEPDAEARLDELARREIEPSELATTEAPNDQMLLGQWQDRVFSMYQLTGPNG
jgi:hypothetical protein